MILLCLYATVRCLVWMEELPHYIKLVLFYLECVRLCSLRFMCKLGSVASIRKVIGKVGMLVEFPFLMVM